MKKLGRNVMIIIFLFLFTSKSWANAGPVFWEGHPSSEILLIDKNTPIAIAGERLVFDFSDTGGQNFSLIARVKAAYEMYNTSDKAQLVEMAFPFVGQFNELAISNIGIKLDGKEIAYRAYVGDYEGELDFDDIINTIRTEKYEAANFRGDERGKLYRIDFKARAGESMVLAIDFDYDKEKTKLIPRGFNGYTIGEGHIELNSWWQEDKTLEIFVLGDDIDFNITGYLDGQMKEKTKDYSYEIKDQPMELEAYLLENVEGEIGKIAAPNQIYNLYAKTLDRGFDSFEGFFTMEEIESQGFHKKVVTLLYAVEFLPESNRKVEVSYDAIGTMDRRKTKDPLYIFDYILNPASNWKYFNKLDIEIIAPDQAPYLIDSSIEMQRGDDGIYRASLGDLPKEDINFILYNKEKISPLDRLEGRIYYKFGYFTPYLLTGGLILFGLGFLLYYFIRMKK